MTHVCEEQCKTARDDYHLSTFAPPSCCNQCCCGPCCDCPLTCGPSEPCCLEPCCPESCCPEVPCCNNICEYSCQNSYSQVKHTQQCLPSCSTTYCNAQCNLTPKRRDVIKPAEVNRPDCPLPEYTTVYRKSYDLSTCNLPSY